MVTTDDTTTQTPPASPVPCKLLLSTYSMWSTFRMCRRHAYWRYIRAIIPRAAVAEPLYFGKLIHACLEVWHKQVATTLLSPEERLNTAYQTIDQAIPNHPFGSREHFNWHLARAIMRGYAAQYPIEAWRVLAIEHEFTAPITNPSTGASSRSFYMGGKIDGLVAQVVSGLGDSEHNFILEHKTASTIDANYLDRLWTDFQSALYALEIERTLNIKVTGVVYNIITKAKLQQAQGETEAEYHEKLAAACAKNKSGKSSLKRQLAETDVEFAARLDAWYAEPQRFHREQLILGREQMRLIEEEVWELTQQFLDCRRRDVWYQNPQACFVPGRPCPYYPICSSNDNPNVIDNLFEPKEPHEELERGAAPSGSPTESAVDPDWDPQSLEF